MEKKFTPVFWTFLFLLCVISAQGQTGGFAVRYLQPNFQFPISNKLKSGDFTSGAELEYTHVLNKAFNLAFPLKLAKANYPVDELGQVDDGIYMGLDLLVQFKHFRPESFVSPYLFAGAGLNFEKVEFLNASFPIGAGLDVKIARNTYFAPKIEYRLALQDANLRNNLQAGLGLKVFFGGEDNMPEPAPIMPAVQDRDKDGVDDSRDRCPDVPGLAAFSGCPDTDGDGVADSDDACPTEAGILKGCPDTDGDGIANKDDRCPDQKGTLALSGCPDSDGDGVTDADDACPNQPGPASTKGCPDRDRDGIIDREDACPDQPGGAATKGCPDSDGDGVVDAQDRCPNTPGLMSNNGCPELKKEDKEVLDLAIKAVQFETAKATIRTSSYAILDKIADIMTRYPDFVLAISGHTDSQGSDTANLALSENRAKACLDYLVSKGVAAARITSKGYGESKPIADNLTAAGREKNRRVEFELKPKN